MIIPYAGAALQRCSHVKAARKITPNPQENTHAKVRPQQCRRAALLKSHSNAGALPETNPQKHPPQEHPQDYTRVYSKVQINLKE